MGANSAYWQTQNEFQTGIHRVTEASCKKFSAELPVYRVNHKKLHGLYEVPGATKEYPAATKHTILFVKELFCEKLCRTKSESTRKTKKSKLADIDISDETIPFEFLKGKRPALVKWVQDVIDRNLLYKVPEAPGDIEADGDEGEEVGAAEGKESHATPGDFEELSDESSDEDVPLKS